jgi:hypothetical protein
VQRLYKRALAAGLVAIAALLVGFQGATTVMTIAEYGASAKRSESKAGETRLANLQTERRAVDVAQPAKPEPAAAEPQTAAEPQAAAPEEQPAYSTGIAAAAKAKALAEIEAMEEQAQPSAPAPRVKRTYRAPRVDKHRIY